jgi:hypothetical protein
MKFPQSCTSLATINAFHYALCRPSLLLEPFREGTTGSPTKAVLICNEGVGVRAPLAAPTKSYSYYYSHLVLLPRILWGIAPGNVSRVASPIRHIASCPQFAEGQAWLNALARQAGSEITSARSRDQARDPAKSKRSAFITLVQAATKSRTNFSCESVHA